MAESLISDLIMLSSKNHSTCSTCHLRNAVSKRKKKKRKQEFREKVCSQENSWLSYFYSHHEKWLVSVVLVLLGVCRCCFGFFNWFCLLCIGMKLLHFSTYSTADFEKSLSKITVHFTRLIYTQKPLK